MRERLEKKYMKFIAILAILFALIVWSVVPTLAEAQEEGLRLRSADWYQQQQQNHELRQNQLVLHEQLRAQWRQEKSVRREQQQSRDREQQQRFRFGR